MTKITTDQIVRATVRREVDEARQQQIDGVLGELHDLIDQLERQRDSIDREIETRDRIIAEADKTGPDPVEVVTLAIHRAVHGDSEPKPEQLDRLRTYARAVVVDLAGLGYLTLPASEVRA